LRSLGIVKQKLDLCSFFSWVAKFLDLLRRRMKIGKIGLGLQFVFDKPKKTADKHKDKDRATTLRAFFALNRSHIERNAAAQF
jgi:hypothetical protein